MAAMEMMVEEDLRFSRDFPLLECAFDVAIHGQESNSPAGVQMLAVYDEEVQERFGNVQKMIHATERLLEVAILKGQESRIEQLEDFRVRLESLPLQCSELLGKKVTSAEIQLQLDPNRVYLDDIDDGVHLGLEEVKQGEGEESDDEDDLLDCPICFEDYKPAEMRSLLGCGKHFACQECMSFHLTALISDAETIEKVMCPDPNCSVKAEEYELESLVPREMYEKYLEFSALQALKKETRMKWCPNKACGQPIIWEKMEKKVGCLSCGYEFCFECGAKWHEGLDCEEAEELDDGTPGGDDEKAFKNWLKKKGAKVKQCPKCKFGIEKIDGCNHMACQQCQYEWCWLCRGDCGVSHYGPDSPCSQLQFSAADTWEEALGLLGVRVEDRIHLKEEWDAAAVEREKQQEDQRERNRINQQNYRRRRRKRRIRKGVIIAAASPLILVGGVVVVGACLAAAPFYAAASLLRK